MKAFRSQPVGDGYLVVARFEQPVRAANVVRELGRLSVWPAVGGAGGLVVDDGSGPDVPLEERDVPPDVVLAPDRGAGRSTTSPAGRRWSWTAVDEVGPFDERVFNPIGFEAVVDGPVVELASLRGQPPTEALVRSLRSSAGCRRSRRRRRWWPRCRWPACRSSRRTATSTCPTRSPARSTRCCSGARRRRRTRRRPGADARPNGPAYAWRPTRRCRWCSRRDVRRCWRSRCGRYAARRGVDLQLVLAAHGFEPDPDVLREHGPERVVVRPQSADVLFGDVLNAGVEAADGDLVLKMDDDDWYGRDFVADLLLARVVLRRARWSARPPSSTTSSRRTSPSGAATRPSSTRRSSPAAPCSIERGLLREVGGFRSVRRYVDAQLIAAVQRAGAATYRTHGLGYLLRRNASGHTWQVDDDYLLDPTRVAEIRPGFAPSRLLDVDEADRPVTAGRASSVTRPPAALVAGARPRDVFPGI